MNKNKRNEQRKRKGQNEHKVYVSMENVFAINKFVLTEKRKQKKYWGRKIH